MLPLFRVFSLNLRMKIYVFVNWTLPNSMKNPCILLCTIVCSLCGSLTLAAQQSRVLHAPVEGGNIFSLRTEIDGILEPLPVIRLGEKGSVQISFDELSHDYHRYVYTLQHCDVDWRASEDVFFSEFAEYTQEYVLIEDYTESRNVTTHYTHYAFDFPNADMRPLLSGNYKLTILCDDASSPQPVAEVALRVVEPSVRISGSITTDTEVDYNAAQQQIEASIDCTSLQVRDLREDVFTVFLQNDRMDNAVVNPRASYINGKQMIWEHSRDLVFPAGNEYRKFEILSSRYPGLHTEHIRYFDPYLHATIMTDEARRNYLLYEDQNGTSVVRNTDNLDDATETEYMITHFELKCDGPLDDVDVYLNADWTTGGCVPEWQMQYDSEASAYVGAFMLKQGYHDYQYIAVPRGRGKVVSHTAAFEGDFYQTENEYRVLVYYRQPGSRYDRLVGVDSFR